MYKLKILSATDLWQDRRRLSELRKAVERHRPGVVALVGDFLTPQPGAEQVAIPAMARQIAALPVEHLVCVRGENEGAAWINFARAWPHGDRPLVALNGTAYTAGPLVMIGFPCAMGSDKFWRRTLPPEGNVVTLDPAQAGRKRLPKGWLGQVLERFGPPARSLWLMHEPPTLQLGNITSCNTAWGRAVRKHSPLLTISGHDRHGPIIAQRWLAQMNSSFCLNLGQGLPELSYALAEFAFESEETPAVPLGMTVEAFPPRPDSACS
jgi:hypothetical protein